MRFDTETLPARDLRPDDMLVYSDGDATRVMAVRHAGAEVRVDTYRHGWVTYPADHVVMRVATR